MPLFKIEINLIHPITKALTPVTLYIDGGTQSFADAVGEILIQLTTFAGKASQLRELAVTLIADIDAEA